MRPSRAGCDTYRVTDDRAPTPRPSYAEATDHGLAQLVPDRGGRPGWTLLVDGVAQSHVRLDDARRLEFAYMRQLASVVDAVADAHDVLHLGAGAMTMPRYVAATRSGVKQLVVERDSGLIDLVRRHLPWSTDAGITVMVADARDAVEALLDDAYDLIVADVYQAAQMPGRVASVEFARTIRRVLRETGRYVTNVVDLPGLTLSRVQAATLRAVFVDVALIADAGMLRGRRYGNVVLSAGSSPLPRLRVERGQRVLDGAALEEFVSGTGPLTETG